MQRTDVTAFFDEATNTFSYIVSDGAGSAAIIDSVMDYDPAAGRTSLEQADKILRHFDENRLDAGWILETHVHADHLTAAQYLKEKTGAKIAIGERVTTVQKTFAEIFGVEDGFASDGSQFDHLFQDGEEFEIGSLKARVLSTPGHTPACVTYVIGDAAFVGDTLFMPDFGTARCDFPGGDAKTLYRSIKTIFDLGDETRLFMCHDYLSTARKNVRCETSVAEERRDNIHIRDGISEEDYVKMREERDAQLSMPKLIMPSVQVNIRAGALPPPDANGVRYLKIPLNAL